MNSIIKAIIVIALIQIISMFGTAVYMFGKSTSHAGSVVLQHRNEVQQQFADERQQMKSFVLSTVEREVSKAMHNQSK